MNMLGNKNTQPFKFKMKNCVEVNQNEHRMYNANSQIKFKFLTLHDYSDEYLLVKEAITVTGQGADKKV